MTDLWLSGVFFQALNTPKLVFSGHHCGSLRRSPDSRRLGRGTHSPRSWCKGVSVVRPPTQIPGYAYVYCVDHGNAIQDWVKTYDPEIGLLGLPHLSLSPLSQHRIYGVSRKIGIPVF